MRRAGTAASAGGGPRRHPKLQRIGSRPAHGINPRAASRRSFNVRDCGQGDPDRHVRDAPPSRRARGPATLKTRSTGEDDVQDTGIMLGDSQIGTYPDPDPAGTGFRHDSIIESTKHRTGNGGRAWRRRRRTARAGRAGAEPTAAEARTGPPSRHRRASADLCRRPTGHAAPLGPTTAETAPPRRDRPPGHRATRAHPKTARSPGNSFRRPPRRSGHVPCSPAGRPPPRSRPAARRAAPGSGGSL